MPNYDWREHREVYPLWRRYPDWVEGYGLLRELEEFTRSIENTRAAFDDMLRRIAEARHASPINARRRKAGLYRPCVFISHRQADVDQAERIAWLACRAGFDYWLDIYDPDLANYPGLPRATEAQARAVALIIELALLNCSHVIAVVTPNTPGSAWVPYEYGRVKDPVPESPQAACWMRRGVTSFPEYLYLGEILKNEADIEYWLRRERDGLGLRSAPTCDWSRPEPAPLG